MDKPTMTSYVNLIFTLFAKFEQQMKQEKTKIFYRTDRDKTLMKE